MTQKLYTFIMEFNGGTFISQVTAPDHTSAIESWATSLNPDEIKGFLASMKSEILRDMCEESPTLLNGLTNVWCIFFITKLGSCLIHYVETAFP